jgi:hypothetical protein
MTHIRLQKVISTDARADPPALSFLVGTAKVLIPITAALPLLGSLWITPAFIPSVAHLPEELSRNGPTTTLLTFLPIIFSYSTVVTGILAYDGLAKRSRNGWKLLCCYSFSAYVFCMLPFYEFSFFESAAFLVILILLLWMKGYYRPRG